MLGQHSNRRANLARRAIATLERSFVEERLLDRMKCFALGQAFVPDGGTVLQEGDVIHVVAREDEMDRVAAAFAAQGGGH